MLFIQSYRIYLLPQDVTVADTLMTWQKVTAKRLIVVSLDSQNIVKWRIMVEVSK